MLKWIAIVLGFQFAGELAATLLDLPLPGPVVGMVLFFLLLVRLGGVPEDLERVADGLLSNLLLFFIPATVGVTAFLGLIVADILPLLAAILVSSLAALVVGGLAMQWLAPKAPTDEDDAV